ncbi:SPT2 chromatin protein-domain-containing protein [Scheffersomyces amazonensis]|uniref:SPT2 chromatin protein-domain-containing protein n=1 Tax=Scheffersomyces amazonensis TaxID=1078765 RepID=UPI00315DB163
MSLNGIIKHVQKKGQSPRVQSPGVAKPVLKSVKSTTTTTSTSSITKNPSPTIRAQSDPGSVKPKKLKFNELMKKATKVDQTKLSIAIKSRSKSPEGALNKAGPLRSKESSRTNSPLPPPKVKVPLNSARSVNPQPKKIASQKVMQPPRTIKSSVVKKSSPIPLRKPSEELKKKANIKAPLPPRGPSAKLQEVLKSKNKLSSTNNKNPYKASSRPQKEDDSDLDSFIASDEEEEEPTRSKDRGYDREEIWAIFNRGKKRSYDYYDSDSDDMEATGADILEEESRSRRTAELEDRRELEEEKRLAALKKARKIKK